MPYVEGKAAVPSACSELFHSIGRKESSCAMGGLRAGRSLGMDLHQVSYVSERQREIISLLTHFPMQRLMGLLGFIKGLRSVKYIFLSSTPLSVAAASPSQEENCWLEVAGTEARPSGG